MLGVARPVNLHCMSERGRVCEEVFRLPLISLLREGAAEEEGGGEGEIADSELGDEEPPTLALDASSTVTTGSHLLYLSDQVVGGSHTHAIIESHLLYLSSAYSL